MTRIAFLGPTGTVSEESTLWFFKGKAEQEEAGEREFVPCKLVSDIFAATMSGEADLGVIPIENTIEGSVRLHMDYLIHESDLPIQAEWIYPSVQHLIGDAREWTSPDGTLDLTRIRKVLSKDVAIAQCSKFFQEHLAPDVEFEFSSSTAQGIRIVKDNPGSGWAAVGTALAAERYGLDILASHITDHDNNHTRFVLVGRKPPALIPSEQMKTTIVVTLPEDFPGALHQVISAFAWRRINLSKIESRPTKLQLGSYYFYIDMEGSLESVLIPAAIEEIEALGCQVRVLGSYPSYPYVSITDVQA